MSARCARAGLAARCAAGSASLREAGLAPSARASAKGATPARAQRAPAPRRSRSLPPHVVRPTPLFQGNETARDSLSSDLVVVPVLRLRLMLTGQLATGFGVFVPLGVSISTEHFSAAHVIVSVAAPVRVILQAG